MASHKEKPASQDAGFSLVGAVAAGPDVMIALI
jgi:hypothetical protein